MSPFNRVLWPLLIVLIGFAGPLTAQENKDAPADAAPELSDQQKTLILLNKRLLQLRADLKTLPKKSSSLTKDEILLEEQRLKEEVQETRDEISKIATGVDLSSLDGVNEEALDLAREFSLAVEPLIREFKEVTSDQKETEKLRQDVGILTAQSNAAEAAVQNLKATLGETTDQDLKATLEDELTRWEKRALELSTKVQATRFQLEERLRNKPTILQALSDTVANFFRSRGAHLLFALAVSIAIFLLLRLAGRSITRLRSKKQERHVTFTERLLSLSYTIFTLLGAIGAFLLTLWLANDWVLLTLAILLILGAIWAGKNTVSLYFEQAKLMLNLGTVRAWERVVYEGISWEVQRIAPYTTLCNPQLDGGMIRLPLRDLQDLHSRPTSESELWFPCGKDDWVELSDGTFGKVIQQTPDYVHLVKLGGTRMVIPTADFLSLHPQNLSKNYRIQVIFGIDYAHQDIATTTVPKIFEEALRQEYLELLGKDQVFSIRVLFTSAGASSLDYRIIIDLTGELAPRRSALRDLASTVCVNVCNEQGWAIPFTQITIHQADATAN
ncbi:MAG: hypothetical protein ACSHYF_10430 [Verrucomicrobiaceae bacterium]